MNEQMINQRTNKRAKQIKNKPSNNEQTHEKIKERTTNDRTNGKLADTQTSHIPNVWTYMNELIYKLSFTLFSFLKEVFFFNSNPLIKVRIF